MSAPYLVETAEDGEPDTDAIFEQYWDDYLAECATQNIKPDYKSFLIWYEEVFV